MTPATEKQMLSDGESPSPLAARLDLLLQRVINVEQFEADMVRECHRDPEEVWNLLALLDQYHRQESLPTGLFRALKASAERNGLVRREPYNPYVSTKAEAAVAPARPAAQPVAPARSAPPPAPPTDTPFVDTVDELFGDEPSITLPPTRATPVPPPATPEKSAAPPVAVAPRAPAAPEKSVAPPVAVASPAPAAEAVSPPAPAAEPIAPRNLAIGSVVDGRYKLEAELERDHRGRNFQALDQQHAGQPAAVSQVALHCMQPGAAEFETLLAERRTEFQLAQPLSHANVLSVRELDHDGVYIYLTMNMMRGETLAALQAQRHGKAFARSAALTMIRDIGAALTYAHEHGVVHGDLQPQSVLISPAGELRVRGFGTQRASSSYASCEQLESRSPDQRDDLYAMGCITYELLQGSHPFEGLNAATARGRKLTLRRPIGLSGKQWRALRTALGWRRENRNLSVARWLGRMQLGPANRRLPMVEHLMAMPPPRRSWWTPVLIVAFLGAAALVAASWDRMPNLGQIPHSWDQISAALPAWLRPASAKPSEIAPVPQSSPAPPAVPEVASATPENETVTAPPTAAAPAVAVPEPEPALPKAEALKPERAPPPVATPAPPPPATKPSPPPVAAAPAASSVKEAPAAAPARIGLAADHYTVQSADSAARILVRRSGATRGDAQFTWWTENGSAKGDVDFVARDRRVEHMRAGQSSVTLLIPIIKDPTRTAARTFHVIIGDAGGGAKVGGTTRADVQLPGNN